MKNVFLLSRNKLYSIGLVNIIIIVLTPLFMLMNAEPIHIDNDVELLYKEAQLYDNYENTVSNTNLGIIQVEEYVEDERNEKEKYIESKQEKSEKGNGTKETISLDGYLNSYVLDIIGTYRGSYPYLLNQDYDNYNGVTETIYFQDRVLLRANPNGNRASHCSGITFEVFFRAMQMRNEELGISKGNFNNMSWEQLYDFVLYWYVAHGPKPQSNITIAVEKYGIGQAINNLEDARPGDFIDFSRENNTGHTAVFINWVKEGNRIIGLRYWSSQGSTGGIAYNTEYFNVVGPNGRKYGNVLKNRLYIARILPVSKYVRNF